MAEPISVMALITALAPLAKSGFGKILESEPIQNLAGSFLGGPVEEVSGNLASTAYNKLVSNLPQILESPENHDLLRSIRRSYLNATLVMCFSRLQVINPSRFDVKNLGLQLFKNEEPSKIVEILKNKLLSNDNEANKEIEWLFRAINYLQKEIVNIPNWEVTEIFEDATKNVQLMLKPENANTQISDIKAKLKTELVAELASTAYFQTFEAKESVGKEHYGKCLPPKLLESLNKGWFLLKEDGTFLHQDDKAKIDFEWFDVLSVFFAEEIKTNTRVSSIFNARMLADLKYQNGQPCNFNAEMFAEKLAESNTVLLEQLTNIKNEVSELKFEVHQGFNQLIPLLVSFPDVAEIIKGLPDLIKSGFENTHEKVDVVGEKVDVVGEKVSNIEEILSEKVDITAVSLPSIDDILKYLEAVRDKAEERPSYYPEHLEFDSIKQRVRIVEKREFEIIKKETEKSEKEEQTDIPKIETQILKSTIEWNETTNERIKRAVILGDPGFGKSWLLKYEARRIALNEIAKIEDLQAKGKEINLDEIEIPILESLSNVAKVHEPKSSLKKTLAFCASGKRDNKSLNSWIYERLRKEENCSIFLDALDEVPQDSKKAIIEEIKSTARESSKLKILLSSRLYGYEGSLLGNENDLRIMPFEQSDVISFVEKWFTNEEKKNAFLKVIDDQVRIKSLAQTPLMLSLLCKLSESPSNERKDFPKTRTEIYKQCLIGLLRDWLIEKNESAKNIDDDLRVLSKIAHELFILDNGRQFSTETLKDKLYDALKELKKDGRELNFNTSTEWINRFKQLGILVKANDAELRFLHLTFQEYLVAKEIGKRNDWQRLLSKDGRKPEDGEIIYDTKWSEVLQLLGGILEKAEDAENYIKTLLKADCSDMFYRPFQLAASATIEAGNKISPKLQDKIYTLAFNKYFNCPKYIEQEWFLPTLRLWRERVIADTCKWVEDYLELRRPKVIQFESTSKLRQFLWRVRKLFKRFQRMRKIKDAKSSATYATEVLEKLNASSELLNILNDERTGFKLIREGAIPKKYPPKNNYFHFEEFDDKTNFYWFRQICIGLGRLKIREVIPELLVVNGINKLPPNSEIWYKETTEINTLLTEFYKDSKFDGLDEKFLSWQGYYNSDYKPDLDKIASDTASNIMAELSRKETYFSEDDFDLALAYGKLTKHEVIPLLWEVTEYHKESDRQIKALRILAELGDTRAVSKLLTIFKNAAHRDYLSPNFQKIAYKNVYELIAFLKGKPPKTDERVGYYLLQAGGADKFAEVFRNRKEAIPDLVEILDDPLIDLRIRGVAAKAIGILEYDEASPKLIKNLKKYPSHWTLTDKIIWSLGQMHVKEALPIIRDVMNAKLKSDWFSGNTSEICKESRFALLQISKEHKIPVLPDDETKKVKFKESRKLFGVRLFNFATTNQISKVFFYLYGIGVIVSLIYYGSTIKENTPTESNEPSNIVLYLCCVAPMAIFAILLIISFVSWFMETWELTSEEDCSKD